MTPLVSVVIPAYNRAQEIGRAIESARNQTYRPLEIIVVDDGSKDHTAEVVAAYPEVRYFHQENQGASAARNQGVALAKGEYVAFLDSDDLWINHKLELQMQLILQLKSPILAARKKYVMNSTELHPERSVTDNGYHYLTFRRQMKRTWIVPSTVIVRKDFFQAMGGFDPKLKIAEDWDLWLKMAFSAPIPRMNAVLTYNFVTKGSLSEDRLEKYSYDLAVIQKWDPRHNPRISQSLFQRWCISFTISRMLKLRHRSDPESLRCFWHQLKVLLPLPRYILWLGSWLAR